MPRYHFDIAGKEVFDRLRAELPDTEAAYTRDRLGNQHWKALIGPPGQRRKGD